MRAEAGTLLLVDDEKPLLRLMRTFLERNGYSVQSAADARSAMQVFLQQPLSFSVVVADVTLPDRPGDQMAIEMAGKNPDLRVLICSGYPYSVETLPEELRWRFDVLQKPWLPDSLIKAIAGLLARGAKNNKP